MELSTICRACIQPISLEYIDLDNPFNETTFFECFNYCTKLDAKSNDKLPKTICLLCANLLQTAFNFINSALEADRFFRECFAQFEDSDGDIKFIIEDQENIVPPTSSEIKTKTYKESIDDIEKYDVTHDNDLNESIIDELQEETVQFTRNVENQEDISQYSNKKVDGVIDPTRNTEQTVDIKNEIELTIFESIEVGKVAVQLKNNAKKQNKEKRLRYILPKEGQETIKNELDTEMSSIETKQNSSIDSKSVKNTKSKIKCHICKKKIRKNYADHMNQHTGNRPYKCEKCDDSFCTLQEYKKHQTQNHKKFRDAWFCNKCGEAFESADKLNTHKDNDHSNSNSGVCLTCGASFPEQDALEQHVKNEHYSRRCPVECTHCKKKYQLATLPMHVRYAHLDVVHASENRAFTCEYCFQNYEDQADLEQHVQAHKGKHFYKCATCGQDFKGIRIFKEHKAKMHPTSNLNPTITKCTKCDFTTTDLSLLNKHKQKHNEVYKRIPKYLCAFCPKKFLNLKPLNDHEDYQHGEQKSAHRCDLCDKKFYSNFKLQTHKKSAHGTERPFMCTECPKAFKLKRQLVQHEKNHYGRKIKCQHCDKKFVHPCYLRVHLRTHTNELPFECHLCGKRFPIKVRLTYHLEKHEGILRKCEYCPEAFDSVAKLRIHRFQHIGYPYVCDVCKENHHKKESFIRHMKRAHGTIMTAADVEENRLRNMKNFYRKNEVEAESPDVEI